MAAIASITNGEAMSSVRTKLNSVITEINILDPIDWIDYSATSTIVGWSSFTTKVLKYRIIGKQMFVIFNLSGTSNAISTTFTIPFNSLSYFEIAGRYNDNGVGTAGYVRATNNSNSILFLNTLTSGTWVASGSKSVNGQFFIDIA